MGTYKFTSVRPSVRPYVRTSVRYSEISESVHRNFLKFGTKLGLPNATELTFSDFARKILFGPFWANLGPKMPFLAQKLTFCPISRKRVIGSSWFCISKLHLGSIDEITKWKFREKSGSAHFGPILVQICPFLAQNQHFSLYLPNGSLNFVDFWYRNLSHGLLLENWGLQSGENLAPPILGPFWSKFAPFWPKINILAYIFQTVHWILLIFGTETYLMVFF